MSNVILVCTQHGENGRCTSYELCRILERIKPEVIFEEMPPSSFDEYYRERKRSNLETDAISMYSESHDVKHIPVDYHDIPKGFFEDNRRMHKKVEAISADYRRLIDNHSIYVGMYGFRYLNSDYCSNLFDDLDSSIRVAIQEIDDKSLTQVHDSWNGMKKRRELEMIKNIRTYSREHKYDLGVFFIGAAHRSAIIQIVQNKNESEGVHWNFNNYDSYL